MPRPHTWRRATLVTGQIIIGLQVGSWYALIALAVVLVLKSTDIPNFAMASMGVLPAYLVWTLTSSEDTAWGYFPSVFLALAVGVAFAVGVERILIRPILTQSHFTTVLMTIGLLVIITSVVDLIWTPRPRAIESPFNVSFVAGGHIVNGEQVLSVLVGIATAVLLAIFFRTPTGLEMRALAEDRVTPRLLGISVGRIMSISWGLSGLIAATALILQSQATVLTAQTATTLVMSGFVAAAVGGFTSTTGAFVGGLCLGVLESIVGSQLGTESVAAVSFVVVFAVLMVRPEGFFAQPKPRQL